MQTLSHVPVCRRMAFWTFALLLSMWFGVSQAQAQDRQFYRFYSSGFGTHFYTTSVSEGQYALQVGYTWEGVAARVWSTPGLLRMPIYRLYSPSAGDHYYTISQTASNNAQYFLGYVYEGIQGYAYPYQAQGTFPIYQCYRPPQAYASGTQTLHSPPDHFYTISFTEMISATHPQNWGFPYQLDGIAFYAALP